MSHLQICYINLLNFINNTCSVQKYKDFHLQMQYIGQKVGIDIDILGLMPATL